MMQALYSNEYGLADAFASFWGSAATLFRGNPNVLGFGLIAEQLTLISHSFVSHEFIDQESLSVSLINTIQS